MSSRILLISVCSLVLAGALSGCGEQEGGGSSNVLNTQTGAVSKRGLQSKAGDRACRSAAKESSAGNTACGGPDSNPSTPAAVFTPQAGTSTPSPAAMCRKAARDIEERAARKKTLQICKKFK